MYDARVREIHIDQAPEGDHKQNASYEGKAHSSFWAIRLHLKPEPDSVVVWGSPELPTRPGSPELRLTDLKDRSQYPG